MFIPSNLQEPFPMSNTSSSSSSSSKSRNGKIVLITGATAGIGRMTALHLAKLGHHVIATGRKSAELAKLAQEATGRLDTLLLDVTSLASITAAVAAVDALTAGH